MPKGDDGTDKLKGESEPDELHGGRGDGDILQGGNQGDGLHGGPGQDDRCNGNSGENTDLGGCEILVNVP